MTKQDWINLALILSGIGGIAALLYYFGRTGALSNPAGSSQPNAIQPVTIFVLLDQNVEAHVAFADTLMRSSGNFSSPAVRNVAVKRIAERLTSIPIQRCFCQVMPTHQSSGSASTFAQGLANRQVARADAKRGDVSLMEPSSCVIGITVTVTPQIVAGITTMSDDPTTVRRVLEQLRNLPPSSLDAFYVFYSPARGEKLTVVEGEKMFADLRGMVA